MSWAGIPPGGVLGGVPGSVFGATATLWAGAAGMTLSALPGLLSPLRSPVAGVAPVPRTPA
ncbi:hypothetical protein QWJ26_31020 [Streptomyces sp. CSDS2]|uniref:hypothetical protein n=1 Tax=Streptomyces sp. CSDS2 TaxID=3055051 RepID=UPI0025B16BC0|nr:hypothetical protein [Streptomyces sp. CSDS2]MDN3264169.1 hypothetical protein [Streptomyces sp. CSDS2]